MIRACCDLGDGGLALAAFEMAEASGVGVTLDAADTATLFGEDQARYLIACNFDQAEALMAAATKAGLNIQSVGRFGGKSVKFGGSEAELADLSALYRDSFGEAFA
jgi:phosphoribosylformylglycinamidine (FGAM) synthase-like enzyme